MAREIKYVTYFAYTWPFNYDITEHVFYIGYLEYARIISSIRNI